MAGGLLLDGTGQLLQQSLSGMVKRQQLIANNLANMDTPGYRAMDVPFEQVLTKEIRRGGDLRMAVTQPGHMDSSTPTQQAVGLQEPVVFRTDGNGVDVDAEMTKLAETSINFNAVTQLMAGRLAIMRMAISEGK